MSILLDVIFILFLFWVVPSAILYNTKKYQYNSIKEGRVIRERTMTNYNFWALLFNIKDGHFAGSIESFFKKDWKPKSGIDKEIAEEEKEVAELERQKEKMERLSELKRRKERLFNDVGDTLKREELNSDIAVSFSGNKNRLDVEFISGWHKVYYSHAYNLDEIKQAIYDGKPIIEEDVRL